MRSATEAPRRQQGELLGGGGIDVHLALGSQRRQRGENEGDKDEAADQTQLVLQHDEFPFSCSAPKRVGESWPATAAGHCFFAAFPSWLTACRVSVSLRTSFSGWFQNQDCPLPDR